MTTSMSHLPNEIIVLIAKRLLRIFPEDERFDYELEDCDIMLPPPMPVCDLNAFMRTCRTFHQLLESMFRRAA